MFCPASLSILLVSCSHPLYYPPPIMPPSHGSIEGQWLANIPNAQEARSACCLCFLCCLIPKEYPLTAWPADLPARLPPATPYLRVHGPANMSRLFPTALGNLLFIHGHDACRKEQVSCPPSQSHNYKAAAKDQCNPMNPLPRCRTMKAFTPSSSGYHAADPSVSQQ